MNRNDANVLRGIGLLLGAAVALHLVTGARARQVHAVAAAASCLAVIGPELFPPR